MTEAAASNTPKSTRRAYPPAHSSCWTLTRLFRDDEAAARAARASARLLHFAAGLEQGAHLSLVIAGDATGAVQVRLHTDTTTQDVAANIPWIADRQGRWELVPPDQAHLVDPEALGCLFELVPAVRNRQESVLDLDDPLGPAPLPASRPDLWPVPVLDDGLELLQALTGLAAQVRVHMSPATLLEQQMIASDLRTSVQSNDPIAYSQYMGTPVRIRCFVGQAGSYLAPRLRAALMRLGVGLAIVPRDLDSWSDRAAWDADELSLGGAVQPFGVAQCLARVPASGETAVLCGVATEEPDASRVPLTLPEGDGDRTGLRIGAASSPSGAPLDVRIAPSDLVLHTQVLGATGTGKSTLLAGLVQEAIAASMGVSVIEPHGTLLERIVDELPAAMAARTIVVRSDDIDNPVPLNVLHGPRSEMVADMMLQVIRDLFDPSSQGIVGPRFERAYGVALQSLRLLFGDRASMSAIPLVYRERSDLQALEAAVGTVDRPLATTLRQEFINIRPEEYGDLVAWINSKFQRLVSTPEMRAILGTGVDAVDVTKVLDDRQLLLVDLASPAIGPLGAQFLGEMWLAKHWQALAQRRRPDVAHLLIVDEAHLFASGLLPRLLSEARKFGVGVVLAHQHLEQLTPDLREATLATTNNVIVFRSGPREQAAALMRLGDWAGGSLTRLPRLQAAATLSQGTQQTDAFTLVVDHNQRVAGAPRPESVGDAIDAASRARFVDPYREAVTLDAAAFDAAVARLKGTRTSTPTTPSGSGAGSGGSKAQSTSPFLDEWLAKRKAKAAEDAAGRDSATRQADPTQSDAGGQSASFPNDPPF